MYYDTFIDKMILNIAIAAYECLSFVNIKCLCSIEQTVSI